MTPANDHVPQRAAVGTHFVDHLTLPTSILESGTSVNQQLQFPMEQFLEFLEIISIRIFFVEKIRKHIHQVRSKITANRGDTFGRGY